MVCEYPLSGYDCEGNFTCPFASPEEMTFVTWVDNEAESWGYENSWTITDENGYVLQNADAYDHYFGSDEPVPSTYLCMVELLVIHLN